MLFITIVLLLLLVTVFYIFHAVRFNYWKKRGIPNPKPHFFVGNVLPVFMLKKSLGDVVTEIYRQYEGYPCVGFFKGTVPALLLRDLEMIKAITVRDFQHFVDNEQTTDKNKDSIYGRNPFVLKGQEWKTTRAQLTPCFTTGKVKFLFPALVNVSKSMVNYIERSICEKSEKVTLELKELCSKYTINNISTCAYGIEAKCFEKEDAKMKNLARRMLTPGTGRALAVYFLMEFPWIQKYIPIRFIQKDVEEELLSIIVNTMKYRKENNIVRNDFMDIIGRLKETSDNYTNLNLAAHLASFFADGFETSSTVMSFALFELSNNPKIQDKLREEIEGLLKTHEGQLTYEAISNEMPYLDAILEENLRKNGIVSNLSKVCTKEYTYHSEESKNFKEVTVTIEKGCVISLPLSALAHDPKYFEEPDKFYPDRFLGEKNQYKYISMPFGEGPRQCLGRRFGLMQIKIGIIHIIKNYELRVNSKTKLPLEYNTAYILLSVKGGIWIDIRKLKK